MPERPFEVRVSADMAALLTELKPVPAKAKQQLYRCLMHLAKDFLPEHACHPVHTLSGNLRGVIYRAKAGRLRIFYTASASLRLAILIDVASRKDGDKHDAYEVLKRRLRAGDYDESLAECGHARPGE